MKRAAWFIAIAVALPVVAGAQEHRTATLCRPGEMTWKDATSLPPGAKMALLEGDPAKDGPYVFRLKLPDGYRIPPHWHPKVERVTVIAGTLNLGMGEKFDENTTQALAAGTYGHWPTEMRHFAWFKGETILQLHGVGPWQIHYVNPQDDPRKKSK